jgi:hypothetical protein
MLSRRYPLRPWRNLTNERPLCLYPRRGSGLVSAVFLTTRVRRVAFLDGHLIRSALLPRFRPKPTSNAGAELRWDMPKLTARITLASRRCLTGSQAIQTSPAGFTPGVLASTKPAELRRSVFAPGIPGCKPGETLAECAIA